MATYISIGGRLCLLGLSTVLVHAIPWSGPRVTESAQWDHGWSPRPTGVVENPLDLFRRAGTYPLYVCGFIGGNVGEVVKLP